MCGICGIYHFNPGQRVEERVVRAMAETIQHRGPDDQGFLFDQNLGLGHLRLSIIDLSEAAHQPMADESGRFQIIFNGEIYNYLELRQKLESRGTQFFSSSDTEVILRLFMAEGPAAVEKLNGMFSLVIWDKAERTLFAVRDRLGIKPFYYFHNKDHFVFGSEVKAIFASGLIWPEMSPEGMSDYMTFQFCLEDKTLFKDIRKLEPGCWVMVTPDGQTKIQKYWNLNFHVDTDHTAGYFESRLTGLLEDAVRIQLRADVPVGAHLSGGLDSSTVTCLAASLLDGPFHSFSGGFKDGEKYDETRYARMAAQQAGSIHHEVYPDEHQFVDELPGLIQSMDEPAAGPGIFPQLMVSKLAKQHVKVVLGGQGADEVFGGYTRYLVAYLEECIRGGIQGTQEDEKYVVRFDTILPNLTQLAGYEPMLRYFWKDELFGGQDARYFRLVDRGTELRGMLSAGLSGAVRGYDSFEAFSDVFNSGGVGSYINKMTRFDILTLLPALLHVEDRTSMAVSLESRVPLLDHRIVELAASMPPKIKFEGGRSKHIFRKVVSHLLPQGVVERKDKMGFPVPLSEWYQRDPVRSFVRDTLLSQSARSRGWFETEKVAPLLDSERAFGRNVWGLLCLELWAKHFLD
ncbi:MAG: asparagine synthase (glutamine-hydrolyzing) [Chloroflexi bacterium]|nr:asparagine synthase (glutamine-hydrolyzing) [Chloroflexota bacterium]